MAELLANPFYYGKIRWNSEVYDGKQEPLITEELFNKVQDILKSKTTPKYRKHDFLFKGLIRCSGCNGTITWEKQKSFRYGHCNHYKNCSQKTWSKEHEVEKQMITVFDALQIKNKRIMEWLKKALEESHHEEAEYHNSALDGLNNRYKQIQHRLDRLYDDKLDEKITKEFYNKKFKQYTDEKEDITKSIQKHSQANTKYMELGISYYELSQKAPYLFQKATQDEKRQLMSLVFDKLTLDEGELNYKYTEPIQILSDIVTGVNSSKVLKTAQSPTKIFEQPRNAKNRVKHPASCYSIKRSKFWLRILNEIRTFFSENPNAEF